MQDASGPERDPAHPGDECGIYEENWDCSVVNEHAGYQSCPRTTVVVIPRQPTRNTKGDQCGACDPPKDERLRRRQSCTEQELNGERRRDEKRTSCSHLNEGCHDQ
jgi:hypothetical protein